MTKKIYLETLKSALGRSIYHYFQHFLKNLSIVKKLLLRNPSGKKFNSEFDCYQLLWHSQS